MPNLASQIETSAEQLKLLNAQVTSGQTTSLPSKCFEEWATLSKLYIVLERTQSLFGARAVAWAAVQELSNAPIVSSNAGIDRVNFNAAEVEFSVARHLALMAYMAATWSIYDRLSNVCGRLMATKEVSSNPKHNPKACEHLLGTQNNVCLGFATHSYVAKSYEWPLKLSYKVRNWLVHEGYDFGETPMFRGPNVVDGFKLNPDAIKLLEGTCGFAKDDSGDLMKTCVPSVDEPWHNENLLEILFVYNTEIDMMFTALVSWSVSSIDSQVRAFMARDQG